MNTVIEVLQVNIDNKTYVDTFWYFFLLMPLLFVVPFVVYQFLVLVGSFLRNI